VGIQGILQQLFDGMNRVNSEAKNMQDKKAKMEVWVPKINHQMDELQNEVARPEEKTNEHFDELGSKCCGKVTEHHEWITDLERRNESTVQEIQAEKLNVGRLEEKLEGTEQNMQK